MGSDGTAFLSGPSRAAREALREGHAHELFALAVEQSSTIHMSSVLGGGVARGVDGRPITHQVAMSLPSTLAKRVRTLSACKAPSASSGGVVYWMSRDQRVQDNWALHHARDLALRHKVGLCVIFSLVPTFSEATIRHYGFMIKGLAEVEGELRGLGIPFHCLMGDPVQTLPQFVETHDACALVADFSPLRVGNFWKKGIAGKLPPNVPFYEVDTHNVVPVWIASDKQEVGARTIRKKITEKLPTWLTEIPTLDALPTDAFQSASAPSAGSASAAAPLRHTSASLLKVCAEPTDWDAVRASLTVDQSVGEIDWCEPGYKAGMAMANDFIAKRLKLFADKRNDPNLHASSDLSPYYHFGQISPHRVALMVKANGKSHSESVASFLEESIVRRELADNYCFYQPNYDSLDGAAGWARDSLELHSGDKREYVYTLEQLEQARSHEDIWNAAQRQMVTTGKMHGFMRMYWAKKILEWSPTPAEALRRAIYLNDRYSIDGRDPNGYVGVGWAIMGVHDMGWAERSIFGKIRFMNYAGCKRKFDLKAYCAAWGSGPITSSTSQAKKGKTAPAVAKTSTAASGAASGKRPASASAESVTESQLLEHKKALESARPSRQKLLDVLTHLSATTCPRDMLESTKIGVTVGKLRKHDDAEVAELAASVVAAWKAGLSPAGKKQKQSIRR